MKELMWKYLDSAYPNIYYKMTKFGACLKDGDNPDKTVMRMDMVRQLVSLFCCEDIFLSGAVIRVVRLLRCRFSRHVIIIYIQQDIIILVHIVVYCF